MFLTIVNIARAISILASLYAGYLLFMTLVDPELMAPGLAASAATSAVIVLVPYAVARMLGDAYRDQSGPRGASEG